MYPLTFGRNFTPTSMGTISGSATRTGMAVAGQMEWEAGPICTVTAGDDPAGSTFPELSVARARMVTLPVSAGIQAKDQLVFPCAVCQVAPLSVETSTRATIPPPESVAVPEMVWDFWLASTAPFSGKVIWLTGATVSFSGIPGTRSDCRDPG